MREIVMDRKTFVFVAGIIFTLVALFHLVRIYMDWPVVIGDWSVPIWVSWLGLVVAGSLAIFALRLVARDTQS
jgi:hypothetical protein